MEKKLKILYQNVVILLFLIILYMPCEAATYSICSSGCTETSFSSFFGKYNLMSGDILEARADTVGGSKTFVETITPSPNTAGTAGNPVIIRARAGDTITIQGPGDTGYASNCIRVTSPSNSYITFSGFQFTEYGYSGTYLFGASATDKLKGITIENCKAITSVNAAKTNSTQCFMANYNDGLTFLNNTCHITVTTSNQTDCFYVQDSSNVLIDGNVCQDDNGNGNGHNDGLQMEMATSGASHDITIRNNKFSHTQNTGGAQQLIFFEHEIGGNNYIYNNLFYNVYGSSSYMVSIANCSGNMGKFYFYNNELVSGNGQILFKFEGGIIYFMNNVLYLNNSTGGVIGWLSGANAPPANFRNNLYYTANGSSSNQFRIGSTYYDWMGWKSQGYDNGTGLNLSVWGNPQFTSISSYPYNLSPIFGSPMIGAGINLSNIFTTDISGNNRTSPWNIGAYQSDLPLFAPGNYRIGN
jgi:hypothetical protein